jgi:hypothetical protein
VDNIVPQIIYAPVGFDYNNALNYYDPYYTTVYVPEPTWDQPAYYPTITVEGPTVTVVPEVGGFPIIPNITIFHILHSSMTDLLTYRQIATPSKQLHTQSQSQKLATLLQ